MTRTDVAVAGHICLDLTPALPATGARTTGELLVPGSLVHVGPCVVSTGGPVSNTGIALRAIGVPVRLMGKVGDDAFGHLLLEKMREQDCAEGIRVVPGEVTSYTIVVAPPGIDRVFLHNPGANDTYVADDVDYDALDRVRIFHFGYPPLMRRIFADGAAELVRIFERAKARGVTTSLDMALPDPDSAAGKVDWDAVLRRLLPHVDLFLPSIEEVLLFLDRPAYLAKRAEARRLGCPVLTLVQPEDYSRLSAKLIAYGAGAVTLKSGPRGVYVRTADAARLRRFGRGSPGDADNWAGRELWHAAFHVDRVASATGSGDCAIAGFLASFLRGERIEETLAYAIAAGTQNVRVYDATSGIRSFAETLAELPALRQDELTIRTPGWRFDAADGIWHGPNDGVR